jgi:UDP-glucose 4-epimerase
LEILNSLRANITDARKFASALGRINAFVYFAASAYVAQSVGNPRWHFHKNTESALTVYGGAATRTTSGISTKPLMHSTLAGLDVFPCLEEAG